MKLSIDVGFSYVKVVDDKNNYYKFPSLLKEKENSVIETNDTSKILNIGNKSYIVGNERLCNKIFVDEDFHGSEKWRVLTAWGLYQYARICGTHDIDIDDLAMGLPYAQFSKKKIADITFNSMIFTVGGEQYSFNIKKFHAFPQGLSVLASPDLDILKNDLNQEDLHTGVLDIGYYTIDLINMKYGELDTEKSNAFNHGTHVVYKKIERMVQELSGSMNPITFKSLNSSLANGSITINNAKKGPITYDLKSKISKYLKSYTESMLDIVYDFWGSEIQTMDTIVYAGGGANLIRDYIPNNGTNVVIQNASFANAKGYISCIDPD
jgi:hypothetical protein